MDPLVTTKLQNVIGAALLMLILVDSAEGMYTLLKKKRKPSHGLIFLILLTLCVVIGFCVLDLFFDFVTYMI